MAAERHLDESGQSVLEFLLMLPLMLGITLLTMRVNMAIQVSIVNQQYARAQALFLTFHNAVYPERTRIGKTNQMIMGVSENRAEEEGAERYTPEATTAMIARNRRLAGGPGPEQEQPEVRGHVRIRNTVTLCTHSAMVQSDRGFVEATSDVLREGLTSRSFAYCRGPFDR